jgi:lysine 6-dehydrogenase
LFDKYDKFHGITAMARTTAYPMSIVAQLILNRAVKMRGVVPPERLGMDDEVFKLFLNSLRKHGINVIEEKSTG